MSNDLWRWADPDGQQRKVRLDELRAALAGGHIAPNTPVWRAGWRAWQPAHEVPELTSASLGAANGVVLNIPPPPLAMVAVQQEYEAASGSIAPQPPSPQREDEPPPPPPYVPAHAKSASMFPAAAPLKTQIGGSAYIPGALASPAVPSAAPSAAARVGPSLPTAIGLPPPPEVLAAAAAARAQSPAAPIAIPKAPPAAPAPDAGMIEELSGSMLLEAPSAMDVGEPSASSGADGLPPPTDPIVREVSEDTSDEAVGLPRRPGLSLIFDDIAAIRQGRPPKNKLLLGVLGAVALSVLIMLVAGVISIASGTSSSTPSASASASAAPPSSKAAAPAATTAPSPVAIPAPPPAAPKTEPILGDCIAAGESTLIAPRALVASALEAHALGGDLALGFAASAHDAVATSLDSSSLAPTATVRAKAIGGDARRVTPMLVNGKLVAMADVDRKGDRIGARRVVSASTLVDVGSADGGIVWAPHGRDSFAKLFSLDGDAPVEALRAVPLASRPGIALTFRQGNGIFVGVAKGDSVLEADGGLARISGLGQVGSPAITTTGDRIITAWADRAQGDDWKIRWAKMKIGSSTADAMPFVLPGGGLGGQAMSPSVASLGGGRFLLAWTEGIVANHQVRAVTIGDIGMMSGPPIAISAPGVNAGQPTAVVGPDGHGMVAFLAAKGKTFEVHATPINCPAR